MKHLLALFLTLFAISAVAQSYPPPKYYNRFTTTPDSVNVNGDTLTNVPAGSVSGMLTNNTTGSAATATNTWATIFSAIWSLNPATWVFADVIPGTNGQQITTVPDISGNNANMANATATPVTLISPSRGIGGHAAINMQANWNLVTGAAPTISYALTNSIWTPGMMTNMSVTMVYVDTMEHGGGATNQTLLNPGTGGVSPWLWIAGTNQNQYAINYYSQSFENMEGVMEFVSGGSVQNQTPTLPLFKLPHVITFRETAGFLDVWQDGVPISFTNLDGGPTASPFSGNQFLVGNWFFGTTLAPQLGAFCGKIAQIIVTTNSPTDQEVQAMHQELTGYYNIGGGPLIAFSGDSLTAGSATSPYTNITGIIKTMIPESTVFNMGLPGEASPNISLTVSNWAGVKVNSTGVKIVNLFMGVNDNLQSLTLSGFETNFINSTLNLQNNGWVVNWCTIPSFNGESNTPTRLSMNTWLYGNTNLLLLGKIVDLASDVLMGTNGACVAQSNLFYSGASPLFVHWKPAGAQELATNWYYPVLQSELYGGGSGGYATTYNGGFTGNGFNLTNLNASALTTGTVPLAQLPSGVLTNSQVGAVSIGLGSTATVSNFVVNGSVNGNGFGWTNLNATNLVGQLPATVTNIYIITNSPVSGAVVVSTGTPTNLYFQSFGLVSTNFVSGQLYTNNTVYILNVSVQVTNITAGVVGNSIMAIQTNGVNYKFVGTSSLLTSLAATNLDSLSDWIAPGVIYSFTNLSSGTGDGAFLGVGKIVTMP